MLPGIQRVYFPPMVGYMNQGDSQVRRGATSPAEHALRCFDGLVVAGCAARSHVVKQMDQSVGERRQAR